MASVPTSDESAASRAPIVSSKAAESLLLGELAFLFSVFTGIPAVIRGIRALKEIAASRGQLCGKGRARAGILLGLLVPLLQSLLLVTCYCRVLICDNETKARVEVEELSTALAAFNSRFGAYPPSRLTLTNNVQANPDPVSKAFLLKCWPRMGNSCNWGNLAGQPLSGDQVLVWALGGMQSGSPSGNNAQCLGFSDNPADPTQPTGINGAPGGRLRPFYDFPIDRLITVGGRTTKAFSFSDPFNQGFNGPGTGIPYLYFCSKQGGNNYTPDCLPVPCVGGSNVVVQPYFDSPSPKTFLKPDDFQIICAGSDGIFGPGGLWTPPTTATSLLPGYRPGEAGSDDLSNFHPTRLGTR